MLLLLAASAWAEITPTYSNTTDCSVMPVKKSLTFFQASSQKILWTFTQGTTAKDLTGATLITFSYVPTNDAWSQVITGALSVATNGSVLITCTPAQLNTNSTTLGAFDWILKVEDADETLAWTYGKLTLLEDPTASVTNSFPTTSQTVDWSDYAAYTHTYDSGPVRPSTGISHTTNADGSVTLTVSATGLGAITGLVGDTEFVVTGSAYCKTGAIASTITRDTELTSGLTAGTNYTISAVASEASLRTSGDTASTNYTDSAVASYVPTNSFVANLHSKKLTGTTGATEGDTTSIAHGVTTANILSFSVLIWQNANWGIVPNRPYAPISAPGVSYYVEIDTANIDIMLDATESENLLEKPITVLLWYTE